MWKKIVLIVSIIIAIAVGCYFGLSSIDLQSLKTELGDSIWYWAIIVLAQVVQVVFLPISNQIISVPLAILFNNELWKVFLASWLGIEIGTIILYMLGRYGGEKILKWLLGNQEKVDKCKNFLNKGKWFYTIGMLIPFIPDDIITTLAGVGKYKFSFVLPISAITRAICVASSVWGFGILTRYWWGWIILGVGAVALLVATLLIYKKGKAEDVKREN